jgi:hypothetical protein
MEQLGLLVGEFQWEVLVSGILVQITALWLVLPNHLVVRLNLRHPSTCRKLHCTSLFMQNLPPSAKATTHTLCIPHDHKMGNMSSWSLRGGEPEETASNSSNGSIQSVYEEAIRYDFFKQLWHSKTLGSNYKQPNIPLSLNSHEDLL